MELPQVLVTKLALCGVRRSCRRFHHRIAADQVSFQPASEPLC